LREKCLADGVQFFIFNDYRFWRFLCSEDMQTR
jgi:hypothetical protein